MRHLGVKGMEWHFLGWFIFMLICLGIGLYLVYRFSDGSFGLLDKVFGK